MNPLGTLAVNLSAFDPFRVPDALLAAAYEAVTPQERAWLKTTQALVQSVYQEAPAVCEHHCQPAGSPFAYSIRTTPVTWTAVLIGGKFAAPCRLSAALMTARLAGVETLLVFFADTPENVCPAIFASCELAGVENLYSLSLRTPSPENLSLYDVLPALSQAEGRMLAFGRVEGIPLPFTAWHDTPPTVAIAPDCQLSKSQILAFHPDALFLSATCNTMDVLYHAESGLVPNPPPNMLTKQTDFAAPLCLGPGLEGTWLHTSLSPAFFHRNHMRLICI